MSEPKEILLFRHGDVEDRFKKRFRGALDVDLSPLGEQMSQANAQFLIARPVELVVTTGLKRSDRVGELTRAAGIPHEVDRRFREASFGQWEGKNWEEVNRLFPREAQTYKKDFLNMVFPGGESVVAMRARLLEAWLAILARPERRIAIIGHSTGNGTLLSHLKGTSFGSLGMQPVGSFHEIQFQDGTARILAENRIVF